nr:hypothetical protein BYUHJPPR_BYUHJPPR_CDS_0005 [Microvirus sp.]
MIERFLCPLIRSLFRLLCIRAQDDLIVQLNDIRIQKVFKEEK